MSGAIILTQDFGVDFFKEKDFAPLTDFASLFREAEGVDRILVAVSWLEQATPLLREIGELASEMEEAVRNAPQFLVIEIEALTVAVAMHLLVLRDRLEDLRLVVPDFFGEDEVAFLVAFDATLETKKE